MKKSPEHSLFDGEQIHEIKKLVEDMETKCEELNTLLNDTIQIENIEMLFGADVQACNFASIREARSSVKQSDTVEYYSIVASLFFPLSLLLVYCLLGF